MLSEIKRYLMQYRRATLSDLAIHFDTEPEAMRAMLEHWRKKGKVIRVTPESGCGGECGGGCCDGGAVEIYQWQGV